MALPRILRPWRGGLAAPLMPLLPSLVLVPLLWTLQGDVHAGGVGLVLQFWGSALQPSLEPVLLRSLLAASAVTLRSEEHTSELQSLDPI